jgi:hypothetical protein
VPALFAAVTLDSTASSIGVIAVSRRVLITTSHRGSNFFQPAA